MRDPNIDRFISEVALIVAGCHGEHATTHAVASRLRDLLATEIELPPAFTVPLADRYAMYPLHVAPDRSFSVAVAVWGVGQTTPIHDHRTWGVVGVVDGVEHEDRYVLRPGARPELVGTQKLRAGDVVVCCTADDDVHAVACAGDTPVIALHVYGTDIGTAPRHAFDPETGDAKPFTSAWCTDTR